MDQTQQNIVMDIGLKIADHSRMVDCYFDMSLNNICRVCLEKNQVSRKMCSLFENNKSPLVSFMIMACASVQVRLMHCFFFIGATYHLFFVIVRF